MSRGETPEFMNNILLIVSFKAPEYIMSAILSFEPAERPGARQLLTSEYMVKWAILGVGEASEVKDSSAV